MNLLDKSAYGSEKIAIRLSLQLATHPTDDIDWRMPSISEIIGTHDQAPPQPYLSNFGT